MAPNKTFLQTCTQSSALNPALDCINSVASSRALTSLFFARYNPMFLLSQSLLACANEPGEAASDLPSGVPILSSADFILSRTVSPDLKNTSTSLVMLSPTIRYVTRGLFTTPTLLVTLPIRSQKSQSSQLRSDSSKVETVAT